MKKGYGVLVGLAIVLPIALNVYQAKRIVALEREIEHTGETGALEVGTRLPELRCRDSQDRAVTLHFDSEASKPAVLYVFSPSCAWCQGNAEKFNSLVAQASNRYRFVGVSLNRQGLGEFVIRYGLNFPVYEDAMPEAIHTYKLGSTPQTIVISGKGTVMASWSGAFVGTTRSEVERFFAIHLPGPEF